MGFPFSMGRQLLKKFQTNLREILTCIKYSNNKERLDEVMHDPRFNAVQYEAAVLLNELIDLKLNIPDTQKGDAVNMCIAFDQIKEDCKRQGLEEGHAQGHAQGLEQGHAQGRTAGLFEANLAAVQSIMHNLNLDLNEALAAINLPLEQQELIRQKIAL